MIRLSLLLTVYEAGGMKWVLSPIQMQEKSILMPTVVEATDIKIVFGSFRFKNGLMKSIRLYLFPIFHLEAVNGTRLSIECSILCIRIFDTNNLYTAQQL